MDQKVEEKLDNLEAVIAGFEARVSTGERISREQIAILCSALGTIMDQHTIAKWWNEEMIKRISQLRVDLDSQGDENTLMTADDVFERMRLAKSEWQEQDIQAYVDWKSSNTREPLKTGLYYLIDSSNETEMVSEPFYFTVGANDKTSLIVRVISVSQSRCEFLWDSPQEQANGLKNVDPINQTMRVEIREFLKYYKRMEEHFQC